jgi:hypothetical protein
LPFPVGPVGRVGQRVAHGDDRDGLAGPEFGSHARERRSVGRYGLCRARFGAPGGSRQQRTRAGRSHASTTTCQSERPRRDGGAPRWGSMGGSGAKVREQDRATARRSFANRGCQWERHSRSAGRSRRPHELKAAQMVRAITPDPEREPRRPVPGRAPLTEGMLTNALRQSSAKVRRTARPTLPCAGATDAFSGGMTRRPASSIASRRNESFGCGCRGSSPMLVKVAHPEEPQSR